MKAYLIQLFRYVAWADQRTLEALSACAAAQKLALPLLAHVLAAEHIWLARLHSQVPILTVWPTLSLEDCFSLCRKNATGFLEFVNDIDDEQLTRQISYKSSQGQEFSTRVSDMLLQVVTHGPYHRGQIAKIIGQAGGTSMNTDFITFTRASDKI